jgi:drug/metabolite transporter (DMT)-like permease
MSTGVADDAEVSRTPPAVLLVRNLPAVGIPVAMDAAHDPSGSPVLGLLIATLAAVLFAVGAVLQHEAATDSTSASGLSLARMIRRPRWVFGQAATMLGTGSQVLALALAPVAVVQPMLAVGLVVALGIRAVRLRQAPLRRELLGAALTTAGLAVFLLAARPAPASHLAEPSSLAVIVAVALSMLLVAGATFFGHGAHGALACGSAAGIAAGIAAVLISVGIRSLREGGWVHALAGIAIWGALVVGVVAIVGGQQAYSRGALAWSLPALILFDPLAAVPAARLLLGERLEPGHAAVWLPAAAVAAIGVVVLARTSEPHEPAESEHLVDSTGD